MNRKIVFKIVERDGSVSIVDNMYWFEENGVRQPENENGVLRISQWTNKYDVSGNMIFENDLITYRLSSIRGIGNTIRQGVVEYDSELCAFTVNGIAIGHRTIDNIMVAQ